MKKKLLLALLLVTLVLPACKDGDSPDEETDSEFDSEIEETTVGPEGGRVKGPNGVTLDFLKESLDDDYDISITVVHGEEAPGFKNLSPLYKIEPVGTEVNNVKRAKIIIPFDEDKLGDGTAKVFYSNTKGGLYNTVMGGIETDGKVWGDVKKLGYMAAGEQE